MADLARRSVPRPIFALFQLVTTLLLAAASSSYQAGPGSLSALARRTDPEQGRLGILPATLGITNTRHTPYWGVVLFLLASVAVVAAAGWHDQEPVLFYAVTVFVSFFTGPLAMARLSLLDGRFVVFSISVLAALVVAFTLAADAGRRDADLSLGVTLLLAALLYAFWLRAGKPRGVAQAISQSERG